jgi:hypothetical protein
MDNNHSDNNHSDNNHSDNNQIIVSLLYGRKNFEKLSEIC